MHFRLPTEAEWEFAARGGNNSRHYQYSGSSSLDEVGWYMDNSGGTTHEVGTKLPNELGIYDMSGNVLELCSDMYRGYSGSPQTNPTVPSGSSIRVFRGGSWYHNASHSRSSYRNDSGQNEKKYTGFRLVLSE